MATPDNRGTWLHDFAQRMRTETNQTTGFARTLTKDTQGQKAHSGDNSPPPLAARGRMVRPDHVAPLRCERQFNSRLPGRQWRS
jgi:hypothetical protein